MRDVAEDDGPQGIADEEDGAEDADRAAAPRLRGHVHQERGQRRVEEAVSAARQEAGEEEEGHDGTAHVRAATKNARASEQTRGGRHDEHGGNDDGPAAARVDEVAADHAHAHRRDGVRGIEEADAVDAQASRRRSAGR